jgi:hypothetical protein
MHTFINYVHRPSCRGEHNVKVCACDPQCAPYGDCCRSSPYFVPEEQRLGASPFKCTSLSGFSLYAMTKCPPERTDSETRNRCEHPDTNYSDPLLDAPVTSRSTNITYQNWYCAACHRDLEANTTAIWDAVFTCKSQSGIPNLPVSGDTFAEYLLYNAYTSQWYLNIDEDDLESDSGISVQEIPAKRIATGRKTAQQKYKYSCSLYFTPEADEQLTFRFCKTDIISTCSVGWDVTEEQELCGTYTSRICSAHNTYRNYHCFICNNLTVLNACRGPAYAPEETVPSFSLLLDWRRLETNVCATSEVYDPLSRVCRKVFI